MTRIEETRLPGVGIRYEFTTRTGRRVGVLAHRSGHRELLIYDDRDPDACRETVRLDEHDSHTLAELLGASEVSAHLTELAQSVEGLMIDWLPVSPRSAWVGSTIGDTHLRRRTGVSVVAVIRGEQTVPSPGADFRLAARDTAVVVGTSEGIQRAFDLLQGS
ncbi:MAG: cation:proton antiporter regulatory subunit [Egibacteraceae bacterium]